MRPNKGDQLFAETIARQYQERTGERSESVKPFAEVFDIAVEFTMTSFKQTYRKIFDELPRKNSEEFCRTIFNSVNRASMEDMALPPCLLKDFFDESLDDLRSGGTASKILRDLEKLANEENHEEASHLARRWSIPEDGVEYLSESSISYTINEKLKCSSIPDSPIDFDKKVFTELLRENLPELVFYLETKLGFKPPLRDIANKEKAELGLKWVDKVKTVRFAAENEVLESVKSSSVSGNPAVKEVSNVAQNTIVHGEGKIKPDEKNDGLKR